VRFTITILLFLQLISCNQRASSYEHTKRIDIGINPAFSENSLIKVNWSADTAKIMILIRNNVRVDNKEDTFYYISADLNNNDIKYFDSLFNHWPKPWSPRAITVLDGIHFTYTKLYREDTSKLELHGPSFWADSVGYGMTSSLLERVDLRLNDPLITDYFLELRSYIEDDSIVSNASRPTLFARREIKYGWKYRR